MRKEEEMRTTATVKGKAVKNPVTKMPSPLKVPIYSVDEAEGLTLGLRSEMLSVGDGSVCTGTGLGTDFIILKWGKWQAVVRGSEILRAWVKTFSPKDAERFPDHVREAGLYLCSPRPRYCRYCGSRLRLGRCPNRKKHR